MKRRGKPHGVSLVELLVSLSLGLLVAGAMVALYLSTARNYRQFEAMGQLQSNARYVFEIMGHDIRMAGNMGCHVPEQPTPANFVSQYDQHWWSNTDRPLFGIRESADANAAGDGGFPVEYGDKALRGDSVIVLRADPDDQPTGVIAAYNSASNDPIRLATGSFNTGSLLLLTDCRTTSSLFQAKAAEQGNAVLHDSPLSSPLTGAQDMTGAQLLHLSANAYYLRNSTRKYANSGDYIPSLYRQTLTTSSGQMATKAEELVSGVTDLQIRYGVDSDGNGELDGYVDAGAVADWSQVLAVRVTITLEANGDPDSATSTRHTLGNGSTLADRLLRRSYTATFGIRQRLS